MHPGLYPAPARSHKPGLTRRCQCGMATLIVVMVMLFIGFLMVFFASKTALFEQRMASNQYWASQAFEAAEAAMEHAASWVQKYPYFAADASSTPAWTLNWSDDGANYKKASYSDASGTVPNTLSTVTINSLTYNVTITFRRRVDSLLNMSLLDITTVASLSTDPTVTATVRETVYLNPFTANGAPFQGSPMVVNGGVADVTGTPDVYTIPGVPAIFSSANAADIDSGHLNLHGGTVASNAFSGTAWNLLFPGIPYSQMRQIASPTGPVVFLNDGSNLHDTYGSPSNPVLILNEGCGKLNGGTIVYGIVYMPPECTDSQGWGNAEIHGTVAWEGGITKLTANTSFNYFAGTIPGATSVNLFGAVPMVPGTWRDF